MNQLVKYEAARLAIAEAKAVDEVKDIHDKMAAMQAYARQAKDKQMEIDASEIRIRAERRLGELERLQKQTVGMAPAGRPKKIGQHEGPISKTPTLAEMGISKNLSSRAQKIAAIPEEQFEATLAEHREEQKAVTARTMQKLARQGEAQEEERFSFAQNYADLAIGQLKRIAKDDPNGLAAFDRVIDWICERKKQQQNRKRK